MLGVSNMQVNLAQALLHASLSVDISSLENPTKLETLHPGFAYCFQPSKSGMPNLNVAEAKAL